MKEKIIIYQLLPRLFSNKCTDPQFDGTIEQNGCGKFNDLNQKVLNELKDFGITHIWLTGIIRHATRTDYRQYDMPASHPDIVKGKAGSPYAVNDYFDVDPDLAEDIPLRMAEFENMIARIHSQGLKAIIDFIPNHVARDYYSANLPSGSQNLGEGDRQDISFSASNNYYYLPGESFRIRGLERKGHEPYTEMPARATGNDVFRPDPDINDWYETVKLNYGIDYLNKKTYFHPLPDTWIKMTEILLFWSSKGIDGFRCDMAGMVPVEFWQYAICQVKSEFRDILFIAELYEPNRYRDYLDNGSFDYLYDKVGMYDTLKSVIRGEASAKRISEVWQSLEGLDNSMLRFLENHDEQRIATPFFASDPWKAIPAMVVAALMNQGPVLIYSGQEVGEPAAGSSGFSNDDGRTSIFDYTVVPNLQKWYNNGQCDDLNLTNDLKQLRKTYSELMRFALGHPVFANGYFYDLMWVNEGIPHRDKLFSFLRYGGTVEDEILLITVCFDSSVCNVQIKIPEHAMNSIGFGTRQRINVQQIIPESSDLQTLLFSQAISIGIEVGLNKTGYVVHRLK